MRKIAGAILILSAAVLYATECIESSLICLEMAIRKFGVPLPVVNNWVLVGFAIVLFLMGLFFLFWKEKTEPPKEEKEIQENS